MGRIRRGWELTKKSWAVLRSNKQLLHFPVYGGIVALVPLLVLVLPGIYVADTESTGLGVAMVLVGAYLAVFATIFFSVGLAATADEVFHGREGTVAGGLAVAAGRIPQIAGWALVTTIIGLIVRALQSQDNPLGDIAAALVGGAWSLLTFLAVPVIAVEGTGPFATLRRCTSLLKSRWAGQITGNLVIGGAVFVFGVLPALLLVGGGIALWAVDDNAGGVAAGAVLVAVGAVVLVLSVLVVQALRQVFGVALFRFAGEGEAVGGFTPDELESAVRSR